MAEQPEEGTRLTAAQIHENVLRPAEREIRRPAEVIPVGFETVTVVGKDGRKIRGVRKNEDTFSVQIMTASEEILSFSKKEVEVQKRDGTEVKQTEKTVREPDGDIRTEKKTDVDR